MKWLVARLGEHSTQIAIGAALASVASALQGQITWQTAGSVVLGSLVTAVMPAKS